VWACCLRGLTSPAIKPRSKPACRSYSVGLWRRCGHRKFFSLAELNQAIRELLDKLNQRPFRKRPGCRASLFQELDRPVLGPLPRERFELQQWATARVNIDYHVELDFHYYSVPYVLTGQQVEIRSTLTTVEIFHRGERVASHVRSHLPYKATTVHEHRPKSHQQHLAWPPSRLLHWAQSVGSSTAQLFKVILESKTAPRDGYRSCLGILRLGQRYSIERVEAAAARALATALVPIRASSRCWNAGSTVNRWRPRRPAPART